MISTNRVIESGKFYKSRAMEKTLSEAINIQVVSKPICKSVKQYTSPFTSLIIEVNLSAL
jgi:hypothetical protein